MISQAILIDKRNISEWKDVLIEAVGKADIVGLDIETQDSNAHEGIKSYRGKKTAKVFDVHRMRITGLSIYIDGEDRAFYFNTEHADVSNRLDFEQDVKPVLDAKRDEAIWCCHNAPFEITNFRLVYGYELRSVVCTLQMAVSAFGPDEYPFENLFSCQLGGIAKLLPKARTAFMNYNRDDETSDQSEMLAQVCGKQSIASHSYNGLVREISYGYGLKKLVKSFFDVQMATFEETLGGKEHMGQLTGEEVTAYGADDAYWAVRLFHRLLQFMMETNPQVVNTFFDQENPMIYDYADIWCDGMKVNFTAIEQRRETERQRTAEIYQELKGLMKEFLPFPAEAHERLVEYEKWYRDGKHKKYRDSLAQWINSPNKADAYEECKQASGAVTKGWMIDRGENPHKAKGPNLTHYMMMRTAIYDLLQERPMRSEGKIQSDGENRGRLIDRFNKRIEEGEDVAVTENKIKVVKLINELAGVEQRMKLYLTPYNQLTDPDTGRMYPVVSSKLATRRLAAKFPNPMQLSKQGSSTYIRGFFEGDEDDHVVVSLDWSQIELVLIGQLSGDPEFKRAYGQLPYEDLHSVAAASILSAIYNTEVTPEAFKSLKGMADDVDEPFGFPLVDARGERLTPFKAYKYNRSTAGGKGANFGYWYSGALSSVATVRGVGPDLMWEMTDAYRQRFAVAEEWRVEEITKAKINGYVMLPDGHRRVRQECTQMWAQTMQNMFDVYQNEGISNFGKEIINRISRRANNQAINALIQGTCATLVKRSIRRIKDRVAREGLRVRFMQPIHDELVWSAHRDDVVQFLHVAREEMQNHPDIIPDLAVHCTASVGVTFEPWDEEKAPFGQIELDEVQFGVPCVEESKWDGVLNDNEIQDVVDYLRPKEARLAA